MTTRSPASGSSPPHPLPDAVRAIVRWHHERVDGLGYPDGIGGDQIPLAVRIVSVADAYGER